MVAYRFEDSRSGDCVARHLAGFTGILQVDGYAAYTQLAKAKAGSNEVMALAGCWAHLRRRFYELHSTAVRKLRRRRSRRWPSSGRLKRRSAAAILPYA